MCVQINRFKVTSTERGKPKKKKKWIHLQRYSKGCHVTFFLKKGIESSGYSLMDN